MQRRIGNTAKALIEQLRKAKAAATAMGAGWPASAPSVPEIDLALTELVTADGEALAAEAAVKVKRGGRRLKMTPAQGLMRRVDFATDMLFGRDSAQKLAFGVEPWGKKGEEIKRLIRIVLDDGPIPGSIRADWEHIDGCTYEVRWFTDDALKETVGMGVSTRSEYIVSWLAPGTQYWITIRPLRGGRLGPVSDPATRVAPV